MPTRLLNLAKTHILRNTVLKALALKSSVLKNTVLKSLALKTLLATTLLSSAMAVQAQTLTVLAAASMTDAMTEAAQTYEEKTGTHIRLSFASSSVLARQLAAGAPADLYISANEQWMDWLEEQQLLAPDTRKDLLANALVMIAPESSPLSSFELSQETPLLHYLGKDQRLAVGDPSHVPAGIYAKQALENLKLWSDVEPRLARADNVRAALALVERGETPLGIVYRTDAQVAQHTKILATFPASSHAPITYPVALMKGHDSSESQALLNWLSTPEAHTIFARFGFGQPD